MYKLIVLIISIIVLVNGADDTTQRNKKSIVGSLLAGLGINLNRCPVAYPLCPINCSTDPAVVHGYCCGCAGILDYAPIRCPPFLQCPISPEPLCSDYRFVMDCCCGTGIAVYPPFITKK